MSAHNTKHRVRWSEDIGGWEMQCDACFLKGFDGEDCYHPLDPVGEYWDPKLGMSRCVTCYREHRRSMQKAWLDANPSQRERKRLLQRAYRAEMSADERRALRQKWNQSDIGRARKRRWYLHHRERILERRREDAA